MRKASLFSGIGGIDLAAHWAGMQTVVFCERETFPQQVLRKHWPGVPIIDDVHDFTREELERLGIGAIDIISAGYPCQPFSHAGKRRGAEDDRHLWPEVSRIIQEIRPRWFLGENVAGHISLGLDDVLADLESIGYEAIPIVLPAAGVGASHKRERVFIVGYTEHDGSHGATVGRGADSPSYNESERTHETGELAGESGRTDDATMANSTCELSHGQRREGGWRAEPSNSGETLADSCSAGCQELDTSDVTDRPGHSSGCGDAGNETLAHTDSKSGLEASSPACSVGSRWDTWNNAGRGGRGSGAEEYRRPTQPGMGGSPYELSDWLDGGLNPLDALAEFIAQYPQPALMGQPQHDWEPPRVATGVKNRVARLRALGNAVDPLQIYPIMYAIKVINLWINPVAAEHAGRQLTLF